MSIKKFYGIKYPFVCEDVENYYIDLNSTKKEYIRSMLMHIIFTPKGQKLRDYEFGTNLIKFLFEPNDNMSWDSIRNEVSDVITRYCSGVKLNDIDVIQSETDYSEIYVKISYTVSDGFKTFDDSFVTKI